MNVPKIFESEYRFCLILWENEPVTSRELSEICKERLGWSKTTTYTVIKRLSDRGVVKNENTIVTSLVSKEEAQRAPTPVTTYALFFDGKYVSNEQMNDTKFLKLAGEK